MSEKQTRLYEAVSIVKEMNRVDELSLEQQLNLAETYMDVKKARAHVNWLIMEMQGRKLIAQIKGTNQYKILVDLEEWLKQHAHVEQDAKFKEDEGAKKEKPEFNDQDMRFQGDTKK